MTPKQYRETFAAHHHQQPALFADIPTEKTSTTRLQSTPDMEGYLKLYYQVIPETELDHTDFLPYVKNVRYVGEGFYLVYRKRRNKRTDNAMKRLFHAVYVEVK